MKTQSILRLSLAIIKLEIKLLKKLRLGVNPSSLKKDFDVLSIQLDRLILAISLEVNEQRNKSGTSMADKRASSVH